MGMKAHIKKAVMPHPMDDLPSMEATLPIMMAAKMISMSLKLATGWIASITKHGPFCNLASLVGYAYESADRQRG
jgi:hypothetical protein